MFRKHFLTIGVTAALVAASAIAVAPAGAQSETTQKRTVKVGAIVPIETGGGTISSPDTGASLEAAVKGFNKRSKTLKLDLVMCDTHGDPNEEVACARKMVSEGVAATLADLTAANPAGVNDVLVPAGIARIGLQPAGVPDYQSPISFPFVAGAPGQFATMGTELAKAGAKKLALLRPDSGSAGALKPFLDPAINAGGGEIVADIGIPTGATDYSPFVAAATSAGAEGVIFAVADVNSQQFLAAANQLNADFKIAAAGATFAGDDLEELEPITEGAVLIDVFPPASASVKQYPGLKNYKADMKASGNKLLAKDNLKANQLRSWASVLTFMKIAEGLETVDAASVLAAMEASGPIDLDGLLPEPWTPSRPGPTALFASLSQPYVWVMGYDGKKVSIEDSVNAYEFFPGAQT